MEPEPSRGNHLLNIDMTCFLKSIIRILGILILNIGLGYAQAPVTGAGPQEMNVEQRLARMERILEGQGLLEMLEQLQQLQQEIGRLRGEIETQNYNLEQLTRRQRDLYTDVDQRIQRIEGGTLPPENVDTLMSDNEGQDGPPIETLRAMPNLNSSTSAIRSDSPLQVEIVDNFPDLDIQNIINNSELQPTTDALISGPVNIEVSPVTATQVQPVSPVQLQAEYQQAFNLLRQSLYDQAIRAFQQFLALHPDDTYSDNAQYWLAEAFYVKQEYQQALDEYNNVVDRFPQSQKINDARLKIGFTLYELGEMEAAKNQLLELTNNLPGTTIARLADERLKKINSTIPNTVPLSN